MAYYDDPENVSEYIEMAEGFDGRALVAVLEQYLPSGSTVLELGMGPGKDLAFLSTCFTTTGSDSSQAFLDRYLEAHPEADLVLLDAAVMDIDRHFDGIYSNKVLPHLTHEEVRASLQRQAAVLAEGGVALHSLWYGDKEETFAGLRFVYYTKESFAALVGDAFEIVSWARYTEMDPDDSIYFVLRKRT
jgi:cyclopropane fatty-acyl-phospholipid synthase-like methyltransferase